MNRRTFLEVSLGSSAVLFLYLVSFQFTADSTTIGVIFSLLATVVFYVIQKIPVNDETTNSISPGGDHIGSGSVASISVNRHSQVIIKLFIMLPVLWFVMIIAYSVFEFQLTTLVKNNHVRVDPYGDQALQLSVVGIIALFVWLPLSGIGTAWISRHARGQPFWLYATAVFITVGILLLGNFVNETIAGKSSATTIFGTILGGSSTHTELPGQDQVLLSVTQLLYIAALLTF